MPSFEDFYEWLQNYGLEPHHVFYGLYRARVTAVNDPEKRGRIQVISLEVGNTEAPDIWAYPAFAGAGADRGWFWPPEVGDIVWIAYPRGQLTNAPVYFGGHSAQGGVPAELGYAEGDDTVPTRRGFVTRMGHTFVLNEEAGKEEIDLVWRKPGSAPEDPASAARDGDEASLKFLPNGSIITTAMNGSTVQIDTENKKIVIDDKDNSNTITIDSNGITIKTGAKVVIDGASSMDVNATAINLGSGASEPAVLGQQMLTWLTSHTHPTGVGPSGPPTPPPTPALLSTTVKVK